MHWLQEDAAIEASQLGIDHRRAGGEDGCGDTIGVATPGLVRAVLGALLDLFPVQRLAVQFHDTRGTALANVLAALELGMATVDASAGAWAAAPTPPAPRATWRPRTCSTCCTAWASRPASTWPPSPRRHTTLQRSSASRRPASTRNHPAQQVAGVDEVCCYVRVSTAVEGPSRKRLCLPTQVR
jgi:HMGL-like